MYTEVIPLPYSTRIKFHCDLIINMSISISMLNILYIIYTFFILKGFCVQFIYILVHVLYVQNTNLINIFCSEVTLKDLIL